MLGVQETSLHPLSIRSFRYAFSLKLSLIIPSSIRFQSSSFRYSSVKHPRYILPPVCVQKFPTVLSIFGADENWWRQPRSFGRPLGPFCIRLCSSVRETGPFSFMQFLCICVFICNTSVNSKGPVPLTNENKANEKWHNGRPKLSVFISPKNRRKYVKQNGKERTRVVCNRDV